MLNWAFLFYEIIDDDDPATLNNRSSSGSTGCKCSSQDPAIYMLTADNEEVSASSTSNILQAEQADPWENGDPRSRGRNEEASAATWRTDAHARWRSARTSTTDGERPHETPINTLPSDTPVLEGARASDAEVLVTDDMTRAMQEAMSVPIPDSSRAYIDNNGVVHMPPDFAWTFNDNRSYTRSDWNHDAQSYWSQEDQWWYNDSWHQLAPPAPPAMTAQETISRDAYAANLGPNVADNPVRWEQWATQQRQREERRRARRAGRDRAGYANDDTLYPGDPADPAPWASLPSFDGILNPFPNEVGPEPFGLMQQQTSSLDNREIQELLETFHKLGNPERTTIGEPAADHRSSLDRENHDLIDTHFNINRMLAQGREEYTTRRVPNNVQITTFNDDNLLLHSSYVRYSGLDEECPICQSAFERGDVVCRLTCRHLFHTHCYREHVRTRRASDRQVSCPCRRGSGDVTAQFSFIGSARREESTDSYASANDPLHSYPTRATNDYSESENQTARNETATADVLVNATYHSGTSLPGRISAFIDPGARVSMAGDNLVKKLAELAVRVGLRVGQEKLQKPMHFQGVGSGSPSANWKTKIPCAIPCTDKTRLMDFTSPCVDGCGESLPILYGLDNMERHRAVLEMDPDKRQLTFPGPGGYKVEWYPGTVHIPPQATPSGHLAFPLDHYEEYKQQQSGLQEKTTVLHNNTSQDASVSQDARVSSEDNSNNHQQPNSPSRIRQTSSNKQHHSNSPSRMRGTNNKQKQNQQQLSRI